MLRVDATIGLAQLAEPVRSKLYEMLARRQLGWVSGTAAVDWAVEALNAGWDALPLAILAGLDKPPNEFEVERYLREAMDELGVHPDPSELPQLLMLILAGNVVSGAVSPIAGCRELYRLCHATGYPDSLVPFWLLDHELELAEHGSVTVEEVTSEILEAARALIASGIVSA